MEGNGQDKVAGAEKNIEGNKIRVLTIYVDKVTQRVEVEGLIGNKQLCLNALGEAVKTVANFDPPRIQPVSGFRAGLNRFLHKH